MLPYQGTDAGATVQDDLADDETTEAPEPVLPKRKAPRLSDDFLIRLRDSFNWSRWQIMPGIQKRLDILRQIVGRHYGKQGGARERVPLPFLSMQTRILARHLVSRSPRCLIETTDPLLRGPAKKFETWAATRFDGMDLEHTLLRWATEAIIYPVALVKVCTGYDSDGDFASPVIENIDPERAVWDMAATSWKQLDYIGHRYTISKDDMLKAGSGYNRERVKRLQPDPYLQMNELGVEKSETLSQETPFAFNRLRDYIDVWEIYLPKEEISVHLPVIGNMIDHQPIMTEDYVGMLGPNKLGPFHTLAYDEVPGNLMASPPVHAIYDLHDAINRQARKLLRQCDRQKNNLLVQSTMAEDAKKVKDASDGDIIPVSHPEAFKETRLGGPDQQVFATMLSFKQLISWFGGNFDALAGLGPQSDTATQDKLLSQASSGLITFMQQEVYSSTRNVMRAMLWYEWNSQRTQPVHIPIPGLPGHAIKSQVRPEQRQVEDFFRLQFSIHPFSMQPQTPQQRVAKWLQMFNGVIMPGVPFMAQQGLQFDFMSFARGLADDLGLTNLDDILKVMQTKPPQPDQGQGQAEPGRVRPAGTGEYVRRNVGPTGQAGEDQQAVEMMQQASQNQQG